MFIRLAYASQPGPAVTNFDVDEIVAASARHNNQTGITGCLSITGRHVVQILERPGQAVEARMERIKRYPANRAWWSSPGRRSTA